MKYYMGIDIGTTNLKAAVFREDGELVSYHSESTPVSHPKPFFSEMDPMEVWEKIKICIRENVKQCPAKEICSVAVSSMGEAGILVEEQGRPLNPFILWYDTRSEAQYKRLETAVGYDRLYEITGQIPSVKYGISKLLWLKENDWELYQRASHWLSVEDWIIYCLSGKYATDYSVAARTLAFDVHTCNWSDEIIEAAGLKKQLFPKAVPGGTAVGRLKPEISVELGLNKEMIVATGGHDHSCAAIAVNIQKEGVMLDSMGTAEVLMMAFDHVLPFEVLRKSGYSVYPHCGKRKYRLLSSNQACGVSLQWYFKNMGRDLETEAKKTGVSRYALLEKQILLQRSQNEKLLFFPFLRGSAENSELMGTFWGMSDTDRPGDYAGAIIDGMAFELRRQTEDYIQLAQLEKPVVRIAGGLSKSDYIMRRKNKIQGVPVEVPVCTEAACFGAALLGAIAAGHLSFEELENFCRIQYIFREGQPCEYAAKFTQYKNIREQIGRLYMQLRDESFLCKENYE